MNTNFSFIKDINLVLFDIIIQAEKLFRDEYYEQAALQVRKYAELLCKDILVEQITDTMTFDDIIQKIKDNSFDNIRMKEFVDDLYFIKNNGNKAAHASDINKNGEIALECIERAFEISIFYSHIKLGFNQELDKTLFSEELLLLEKPTKKNTIKEKYIQSLNKERIIKVDKTTQKAKSKIVNVKRSSKENNNKSISQFDRNSTNFVKIIFLTLLFLFFSLIIFAIFK